MSREYPHIEWAAQGHRLRDSRWSSLWDSSVSVKPQEIAELSRNPHLAHHINTLMPQIFPGPPQVHVVDQDGEEPVPELSRAISDSLNDAGLYASMRRAYIDCLLYGCAVRSVSVTALDDGKYLRVDEIRDLPASSFSTAPPGGGERIITPNRLMPGLVINNGEPEAYQTDPYDESVHKLNNWDVICDPTTPQPFGEAYCLPIYSVLDSIAVAEAALDMSVQRRGVPLLTLKIKEELPAQLQTEDKLAEIVDDAVDFVRDWGMGTGAILPQGIEVPPVSTGIIDGADAHERILDLDALLDSFFSPASALSPGRTDQQALFGASQQSRAQIWRAHITGQQAWIEEAYEQLLMGVGLLAANGCPDEWRLEIRLDRPAEEDIHARTMAELQLAVSAGVIGVQEIREHLAALDLADEIPDDLVGAAQQIGNTATTLEVPLPSATDGTEEEVTADIESAAAAHREVADAQDDALITALRDHSKRWKPRLQAWIEAQRAIYADSPAPPRE